MAEHEDEDLDRWSSFADGGPPGRVDHFLAASEAADAEPRQVEAVLQTSGPSVVTQAGRVILAIGALVLAFTAGQWSVPTHDETEIKRVRTGLCILLDDLGVDSLGARDLFACPPR